MPPSPKLEDVDYIQFLLAAQTAFSCVEAACSHPGAQGEPPAHDAYTRLLLRQPPDPEALWQETQPFVHKDTGLLVLDDSTLDKPHARHMMLVHKHWSGKHHKSVLGINLITLLWTDGGAKLPIDCRLSNAPVDGVDKNQHFRAMLATAKQRGLQPRYVCFDSWYSGLDNLKAVRSHGWHWLTRFKSNRAVDPDDTGNRQIYLLDIPPEGRLVHLRGYGFVKVFVTLDEHQEEARFWASSDLCMTEPTRGQLAAEALAIEEYHRGLKQCCAVERCQARSQRAQHNHIIWAIRAFVRLEWQRLQTGRSWYESKKQIVRQAIRAYRADPLFTLATTA
jgi:putative transposase